RLEGGSDAVGLRLGDEALVLLVGDGLGLVDQHDRDVVADGVAPLQPRVVEALLVGEVEERALVLGTGEDLEQLRVERHAVVLLGAGQASAIRAWTSATCWAQASASAASRLRRSRGSVFDGRRLNDQSPRSTVSPSRRSGASAGQCAATAPMTARGSATFVLISPEAA